MCLRCQKNDNFGFFVVCDVVNIDIVKERAIFKTRKIEFVLLRSHQTHHCLYIK